ERQWPRPTSIALRRVPKCQNGILQLVPGRVACRARVERRPKLATSFAAGAADVDPPRGGFQKCQNGILQLVPGRVACRATVEATAGSGDERRCAGSPGLSL